MTIFWKHKKVSKNIYQRAPQGKENRKIAIETKKANPNDDIECTITDYRIQKQTTPNHMYINKIHKYVRIKTANVFYDTVSLRMSKSNTGRSCNNKRNRIISSLLQSVYLKTEWKGTK